MTSQKYRPLTPHHRLNVASWLYAGYVFVVVLFSGVILRDVIESQGSWEQQLTLAFGLPMAQITVYLIGLWFADRFTSTPDVDWRYRIVASGIGASVFFGAWFLAINSPLGATTIMGDIYGAIYLLVAGVLYLFYRLQVFKHWAELRCDPIDAANFTIRYRTSEEQTQDIKGWANSLTSDEWPVQPRPIRDGSIARNKIRIYPEPNYLETLQLEMRPIDGWEFKYWSCFSSSGNQRLAENLGRVLLPYKLNENIVLTAHMRQIPDDQ